MSGITIENISYRYKKAKTNAINNLSCVFREGKVSAVVGPSGSGKTTLLSIMAGLDTPMAGNVIVNGDNLLGQDLDRYRRERVSMIFQAFHLFPLLTALENVCYPMEMNGLQKAQATIRAKELLESVGIDSDKYKRYPSNLSGGEQQRVAIARALATGARILLADEPTGNLDAGNGKVVLDLLHRLAHDEKYCVVIVTHDPQIAAASDVIYRMANGTVTVEK